MLYIFLLLFMFVFFFFRSSLAKYIPGQFITCSAQRALKSVLEKSQSSVPKMRTVTFTGLVGTWQVLPKDSPRASYIKMISETSRWQKEDEICETLALMIRLMDCLGSRVVSTLTGGQRDALLESRCRLRWVAPSKPECWVKLPASCRVAEYI